jgi:GNAT superfamily N-acetyltransferase
VACEAQARLYEPGDRPAVRQLCCDTADAGGPADRLLRDREAMADVLTRYYTDYEPQSLWIAEHDGRVVGYLTGCLDTRRCDRITSRQIVPRAAVGAITRGALWHADAWRLLAAFAATVVLGGFPNTVDLDLYPAHLHINIREDFRGQGLGRQLVERFRQQADRAAVAGIHLLARGDNSAGRRFFQKRGFTLLREQPLILPEGAWFKKTSTAIYGWRRER